MNKISKDEMTRYRQEGANAFKEGKRLRDNPFAPGQEKLLWAEGYYLEMCSTQFTNPDRHRRYGLRPGDIVEFQKEEYEVSRIDGLDNNSAMLFKADGSEYKAVAEWCKIKKKIEDRIADMAADVDYMMQTTYDNGFDRRKGFKSGIAWQKEKMVAARDKINERYGVLVEKENETPEEIAIRKGLYEAIQIINQYF